MTDILSLPPEILNRILDYLPLRELSSVCLTCKKLRDVVYVDSVWQKKCKQEYNFKSIEGWNVNYRTLYSKGLEVLAPASSRVDRPLRKKDMFIISMTSSENVQVVSVHSFPEKKEEGEDGDEEEELEEGKGEQRPCLLRVEQDEIEGRVLEYKVTDANFILQKEGLINHPVFRRWIAEELEDDPYAEMYLNCVLRKGVTYLLSRQEYRWFPLELPSKYRVNVPIQPGLFKGTYSAHGIEILSLDYNDDLTEVTVTKITGDPNVPASEISLFGDLTSPLVLTAEQQENLDSLTAVPEHHAMEQSGSTVRQPFRIPEHFSDRDNRYIPEFCTFRCRAKGRIAGHSFMTPCFSKGHFIVFDESKFGMVWLELTAFSIYFRVDENELKD
uniref:F-box only protein 31-B n=1 Tax=Magallana gigas TaxID=29159 RepID=K1PSS1_MAGGI